MSYDFDPLGTNPANSIKLPNPELHVVPQLTPGTNHRVIIPNNAPYFLGASLRPMRLFITNGGTTTELVQGIDWTPILKFDTATYTSELPIYGGVSILHGNLIGTIGMEYHTVGGNWTLTTAAISILLGALTGNLTRVYWEQVANYPSQYPPVLHPHESADFTGMADIVEKLVDINESIQNRPAPASPADYVAFATNVSNQLSGFIDQLNAAISGVSFPGLEGDLEDLIETVNGLESDVNLNITDIEVMGQYISLLASVSSNIHVIDSSYTEPPGASNILLDVQTFNRFVIPSRLGPYPVRMARRVVHITGAITGIVLRTSSMLTADNLDIVYRGDDPTIPLVISIENRTTELFVTYNQKTKALVTDTTLSIDVINKPINFKKLSNGNIHVIF